MSGTRGDAQVVGVYATTQRRQVKVDTRNPLVFGHFVQVGRQGNPLFCEAFVPVKDKNRYNRTSPDLDRVLFGNYAGFPELATLLNALVFAPNPIPGIETNRFDLEGIFIPDLIKVDLSTDAVPLAGGGPSHPTNPDDAGFSRLSIFGGDTIFSPLAGTQVPSGWPNGRRFGDDVLDIGVSAVISDLRTNPPVIRVAGDNVDSTEGRDTDLGDSFMYNVAVGYQLWPSRTANSLLVGVLELNGVSSERDRVGGSEDPETGGSRLYVSLGLEFVTRRFIIEAGVKIPVVQELHGNQLEEDYSVSVGVRIQF